MKKFLFLMILAVVTIGFAFNAIFDRNAEANGNEDRLKEKIEQFSALNAEDQVKIATIEKKLVFAKDDQIILFVDESGGVGYAMMKNGKMETVVYGDMEQGYDQVNNFFIAYGKKPDKENTELTVVIHTDNNHRDIQKSFPLEQGSFYLVAEELPEDITHTRVLMENYQFK